MSKRFRVALSFPGEHRDFVLQVAEALAATLTQERVFYDEWFEVDLLGAGGDLKLQAMYEHADLVIPFFSQHYGKPWCMLEWETIRGILLKRRFDDAVIPVHLDETDIPGWSAVNFGIKLQGRSPQQIAEIILEALAMRGPQTVCQPSTGQHAPSWRKHNLPLPSLGSRFKGREESLQRIQDELQQADGRAIGILAAQAIHGLGGIGKTQLAVEYAWRHLEEYDKLFFVLADSPENLDAGLAELCGMLELPQAAMPEQAVRVQAVSDWLGGHSRWLLILDNVDDELAALAVQQRLEACESAAVRTEPHGPCHILITARWTVFGPNVRTLPLDVLDEAAAVAYLLEETLGRRAPTATDAADARVAALRLDRLRLKWGLPTQSTEISMCAPAQDDRTAAFFQSAMLQDAHPTASESVVGQYEVGRADGKNCSNVGCGRHRSSVFALVDRTPLVQR